MPWSPAIGAPSESSSESESETDSDEDPGDISRRSSEAPEADETPPALPPAVEEDTPEARVKRRLSLGWGRFKPRLGKPRPKSPEKSEEKAAKDAPEAVMDGKEAVVPPKVTVEPPLDTVAEGSESLSSSLIQDPASPTLSAASGESDQQAPGRPRTPAPPVDAPQRRELETKILRQMQSELGSGEFYYSFEFDSSHSLQYKRHRMSSKSTSANLLDQLLGEGGATEKSFFPQSGNTPPVSPGARSTSSATSTAAQQGEILEPDVHLPLWRRYDRRFFWNEWLVRDFIDLGLHAYILPISQGWVQASSFTVPIPPSPADEETPPKPIPIHIALISRRSKDRAGLRYQRRGIDHEGHVANFVETEMLVRANVGGKVSLFSFVQIRGSIPLKWSQLPWSMKPPPVLDQPVDQTFSVANLHFDDLKQRYGPVVSTQCLPLLTTLDHRQPVGTTWQRGCGHERVWRACPRSRSTRPHLRSFRLP